MYLVSLYFDKDSERTIQKHITKLAERTGNTYMLDNRIPPHLTIGAYEGQEDQVIVNLEREIEKWTQGRIEWVSIGCFLPHTLYLTPVLNEYLHERCAAVYRAVTESGAKSLGNYLPFGWVPHTTVARKLSDVQMALGIRVLQANFRPFTGRVARVGVARNHPYQELGGWKLSDRIEE